MYIWYRHKFEWEMKTIKIFTIAIFSIFISQACNDATEVLNTQKDTTNTDTITRGCLASYELNPEDNNEKINQVYNKDKVNNLILQSSIHLPFLLEFMENLFTLLVDVSNKGSRSEGATVPPAAFCARRG